MYVYALIAELFSYRPFHVNIHIDGKLHAFKRCFLLTVNNQPYFGGGMKINPFAENNAEHFSIVVVDSISKWKVLFLFVTVFFGLHTRFKEVFILNGKQLKISIQSATLYQIDGEPFETKSCSIEKQPYPLRIKGCS